MSPIKIQNIFVKNFSKNDAKKYDELLPVIAELGGQTIEIPIDGKIEIRPNERLIFLGKPHKNFLNFAPRESILEEFESFAQKNLDTIFLQNVKIKFDKNASEIFPKKVRFLGENGAIFAGKFEKPAKTRMKISGISNDGEITAIAVADLKNSVASREISAELPIIWDELRLAGKEKNQKKWSKKWISIFPMILVASGLVFFIFAWRSRENQPKKIGKINLPFEIEKKHESQ